MSGALVGSAYNIFLWLTQASSVESNCHALNVTPASAKTDDCHLWKMLYLREPKLAEVLA